MKQKSGNSHLRTQTAIALEVLYDYEWKLNETF